MHYFFLEGDQLTSGREVELRREDLYHAHHVLRLKAGDIVAVSDGYGMVRSGSITVSEPRKVLVRLNDQLPAAESTLKLTLFQSPAKGEKMDTIIRQAVELGVMHIVPVVTGRSIPRWKGRQEENKIQRWRSIVRSAAAQCRRAFLPCVENVQDLQSVLSRIEGHKALVLWEEEKSMPLTQILKQPCPLDEVVFLFIGPEGGFAGHEIEAINKAGAITVHIGPRIMRTETAAVAAISIIQAAWGDLAGERENW